MPQTIDTTNAQPSTSDGTPSVDPIQHNETIMVPAMSEETRTAIDALLSLGSDLRLGLDEERTDNEILQPIAPNNVLPDPTSMISEINSDDTEVLDKQSVHEEETNNNEL